MYRENATYGTAFFGRAAATSHEYYHLGRARTKAAGTILSAFASTVSSLVLARGVDRNELFERFDVKLWSYNDNLVLFTLATLPSLIAMAVLFLTHRGLSGVRVGLSI